MPWAAGRPVAANGAKPGEWPTYAGDLRGSKYSPLDQIHAGNFADLQPAWRVKTDNFGPRRETKLEGTPLMVNGWLYATAGTRRAVVALNPRTGELKWVYSMEEGERASRWAPRQLSGRGLAYWTDGRKDERILYVTTGYRLVALDAATGQPVRSFGQHGVVDLKQGVVIHKNVAVDRERGEIGLHAAPTVVNDMIIVGSAMAEGLGYLYSANVKGLVRAFDVRTGKLIWRFDTIPKPGELGNHTWENGSWEWTGNTGAWAQITADPEAGLAYLPIESPTIDHYGGNRPGDNLFAESIVAVDIKTGRRKWHFQVVHHPLWDHDIPSAPLLIDTAVDGRPRKLVAIASKQGWLYVLDRLSGEPIWPIPERPVPQSDVPGERTSATQPIPTKPPPFARTHVTEDDLIDFTPQLRAQALLNLKRFRWEGTPYVPPVGPQSNLLGSINIGNATGGANWPGAGFDPETGIVYTQAINAAVTIGKLEDEELRLISPEHQAKNRVPRWDAEKDYGLPGNSSEAAVIRRLTSSPGYQVLGEGLDGLPIVKPPYGVLAALDLSNGTLKFQVPHGDTPNALREHPRLKGLTIPTTGQGGNVGVLVTKTLVIVGDPQFTQLPGEPRGAKLRAYDKQTGAQLATIQLPAPVTGQPMTYVLDGRQYIVVGVSGGNYSGEYIGLALPAPASERRP